MKKHDCENCTHEIIIRSHKCIRCENIWNSLLERPKQCPKCKSTYWDTARRERIAAGDKPILMKYAIAGISVGETLVIPWPHEPYQGHRADGIVSLLNEAGGRFTVEYKIDGAHITRGEDRSKDPGPIK